MSRNLKFVLELRARPTRSRREISASSRRRFATPGPGEILVRHHYLSLDPYMRGRLSDAKSYAKPQELGATMGGGTVGEVVASNNPRFKTGDFVVGMGGWQHYVVSDGRGLTSSTPRRFPLQAYLGPVGMPGVTAWYGLNKIIAPKAGETVVVSAATGAVGSVVGQLAKIAGARAVGVAGGAGEMRLCDERTRLRRLRRPQVAAFRRGDEGGAAARDRRAVRERRRRALRAGLRRLNDFARIAICGLIASYEGAADARCRTCGCSWSGGSRSRASSSPTICRCGRRRSANSPAMSPPAACAGARRVPRGPRKRAAGAGRPAARRQFRQDAGQVDLVLLNIARRNSLALNRPEQLACGDEARGLARARRREARRFRAPDRRLARRGDADSAASDGAWVSRDTAQRILAETRGAVTPNDFLDGAGAFELGKRT